MTSSTLLPDLDESTTAEYCEVVLDNRCEAAPENEPATRETGTRARCYACGMPACKSCSAIRTYYGARRRICATCEEDRFEDGAAQILKRAHHRAGYTDFTLAHARAMLTPAN